MEPNAYNFLLRPGGPLEMTLTGHVDDITSLCALLDGRLVSASRDGCIKIWNLSNGHCDRTLRAHAGQMLSLCQLKDGRLLSGSISDYYDTEYGFPISEKHFELWNVESGNCELSCYSLPEDIIRINELDSWYEALNPRKYPTESKLRSLCDRLDSRSIAFRNRQIDDWSCLAESVQVFEGHWWSDNVLIQLDDKRIAAAAPDKSVRICNLPHFLPIVSSNEIESEKSAQDRDSPATDSQIFLSSLSDGRVVVGNREVLSVWDSDCKTSVELSVMDGMLSCLCPLKRNRLATGSMTGYIQIWNSDIHCDITFFEKGHEILFLRATGDDLLVSAMLNGNIKVWNLAYGYCCFNICQVEVISMCSLSDGRLVSLSKNRTIHVWNLGKDQFKRTICGHDDSITALCTLTNGNIASCSNHTINIWSADSSQYLQSNQVGGMVNALCALSDGRLVSGSRDGTIQVWRLEPWQCVASFPGEGVPVLSLCCLHDQSIAIGFDCGNITIRNLQILDSIQVLVGHLQGVSALCRCSTMHLVSGSHDSRLRVWNRTSKVENVSGL